VKQIKEFTVLFYSEGFSVRNFLKVALWGRLWIYGNSWPTRKSFPAWASGKDL